MRILFSSIALPIFCIIRLSFCQSNEVICLNFYFPDVAGKMKQSFPAALFSCCCDLSGPVLQWQSQKTKAVSEFACKEVAPECCLDLQRTLSQKNRHLDG